MIAAGLLPSAAPLQLIDQDGQPGGNPGGLTLPAPTSCASCTAAWCSGAVSTPRPPRSPGRAASRSTRPRAARTPARSARRWRCATRTGCSPPTATRSRPHPRRARRRGPHPAARRLALRLRPLRAPGRAAVHPAGHQHAARRRPRARRPAQGARTRSRWRCSATARPARATPTRRSTSRPSGRRRSCSSCRTTATRSACRWPSRPRRRRSPPRASATASRRY